MKGRQEGRQEGGRKAIYGLLSKLHVRHEGFSFFGPRKSGEGSGTDRIIFAGLISPFYLGSECGIDVELYSNHAKEHEKPVTWMLHWKADMC